MPERAQPANGAEAAERRTYPVWLTVSDQIAGWRVCEVIFTCPLYYDGCRALFPGIPVVGVSDSSRLIEFLVSGESASYRRIGILSPQLLSELVGDAVAIPMLVQRCQRDLLAVLDRSLVSNMMLRKTLHREGFYEVCQIENYQPSTSHFNYSSVGILPTGEFDMRANSPAFETDTGLSTIVASRVSQIVTSSLPWHLPIGQLHLSSSQRFRSAPDQLSLAICDLVHAAEDAHVGLRVEGEFTWSLGSNGSLGHASLVACYSGPGDEGMIAALLQPCPDGQVSFSIWQNDHEWSCCGQVELAGELELRRNADDCFAAIWMEILDQTVSVGIAGKQLLRIDNVTVPFVPRFGLRIFNDQVCATAPIGRMIKALSHD